MAGRVVEVIPNVSRQIVAIPVKANLPVKAGDVLFQIDQTPFQYNVAQLQASLAAAKQQAEILKSNYKQATANVAGLTSPLLWSGSAPLPLTCNSRCDAADISGTGKNALPHFVWLWRGASVPARVTSPDRPPQGKG